MASHEESDADSVAFARRIDDQGLWQRSSTRRIVTGVASVQAVIAFGVFGYVCYGWGWFDALVMVIITGSGVGFGEARPLVPTGARTSEAQVHGRHDDHVEHGRRHQA